jgi:hypothetical protein
MQEFVLKDKKLLVIVFVLLIALTVLVILLLSNNKLRNSITDNAIVNSPISTSATLYSNRKVPNVEREKYSYYKPDEYTVLIEQDFPADSLYISSESINESNLQSTAQVPGIVINIIKVDTQQSITNWIIENSQAEFTGNESLFISEKYELIRENVYLLIDSHPIKHVGYKSPVLIIKSEDEELIEISQVLKLGDNQIWVDFITSFKVRNNYLLNDDELDLIKLKLNSL